MKARNPASRARFIEFVSASVFWPSSSAIALALLRVGPPKTWNTGAFDDLPTISNKAMLTEAWRLGTVPNWRRTISQAVAGLPTTTDFAFARSSPDTELHSPKPVRPDSV